MKTFRQRLMHDVNESVTALSNGHDDAFKALEYGPVHLHVLVDITPRSLRQKKRNATYDGNQSVVLHGGGVRRIET